MHPARWSDRARLLLWGGTFALLAGLGFGSLLVRGDRGPEPGLLADWRTVAVQIVTYGALGGIVLLLSAGPRRREMLALRAPASWRATIALMLCVQIAWVVVAVAAAGLFGTEGRELAPGRLPEASRGAAFFANAVLIALVAPAVEEALSRGVGYALLERYGPAVAVLGSGVAFALGHGVVRDLPVILVLGLGFSLLRAQSGSLLPSLILHVFTNTLAMLAAAA